jgi:hypothetical protein
MTPRHRTGPGWRAPLRLAGRAPAGCAALALVVSGSLGCSGALPRYPEDPVFRLSVRETPGATDTLLLEIENRSNRALHFSDPERWNYVNLVKVGFRVYQPVFPVEARRAISDRAPDRDGDMVRVRWVLPVEGGAEIDARSRAERTIRVPEDLGGGRYSLALVVVARAQGRWLTVEEPVLGPRTAALPGAVRALAGLVLGCLLLAGWSVLSLLRPRRSGSGSR